jgi:tetratricopeptide (TPR) repeat protein
LFKQVAGGYVFRAPNPKVFGSSDHYLVDAAQRDQIVAIITPGRPVLLFAVWIGGFFVALGAAVVALLVVTPHYPVTVLVVLTVAMLLVAVLALHLSANRKLRRLQPILAGVPQTDQRITIAEIRQALNQGLSYQQLRRTAISNAIACVASVAGIAVQLYFRKHNAGLFSDPLCLLFGFNALIFGLSSVSSFRSMVQKREHADVTGPAVDPIFNKASRYVISACALALLVFLGATAWIEVKREFSDHSQGLRYEAKGEHDSAITSFSKAIAAEPNNSDAYLNRAGSYSAKGDHDHAIADYTKAIEIEPSDAAVYRKRADAYRVKGALDNAITDYSKAIELDPRRALAYYLRGLAYTTNNNSDRAIADFTKAIEINPNDAYAYVSRGRSFEAKGDHDHATADLSKAIEINPNYANAYYLRGLSYAASKNSDHAIADFTKTIEIDPRHVYSYVSRARSFEAKGATDNAITDYDKAIELDPKYANAYYFRGLVYAANKNSDHAIADSQKPSRSIRMMSTHMSRARGASQARGIAITPLLTSAKRSRSIRSITMPTSCVVMACWQRASTTGRLPISQVPSRLNRKMRRLTEAERLPTPLRARVASPLPTIERSWSCRR